MIIFDSRGIGTWIWQYHTVAVLDLIKILILGLGLGPDFNVNVILLLIKYCNYIVTMNTLYVSPQKASSSEMDMRVSLFFLFWLRQKLMVSQCPSVCPSGTKCSRAVNLHLSRSESNQSNRREIREYFESTMSIH